MENGVMIQYFEWNLPDDGNLWNRIKNDAEHLHQVGITSVWIPPAYKGRNYYDEGYGVYDLYDLGEFDQKGAIRTKYGTKKELKEMVDELHKYNISVYLDAVMNHKAGGDFSEKFTAVEVDPKNRHKILGEPHEIEAMTGFDFPGRKGKYSDFKWDWNCFSGVEKDLIEDKEGIFRIAADNKSWSDDVDNENVNYDYLIFCNLDFNNPQVSEEMKKWGVWVAKELDLDGMRLDAIKHMDSNFMKGFVDTLKAERGEKFFFVGEYWKRDLDTLEQYLSKMGEKMTLFDVPLHYNMYLASLRKRKYDLRKLFKDTLLKNYPQQAVTFVDNHDSQKDSSLESEVQDWFKPSAYGIILLMKDGYPCIFYGDYYDIKGNPSPHRKVIDKLLLLRKKYAYGKQKNYFDKPHAIGFVRMGSIKYPDSGMAVLISNGNKDMKEMNVGKRRAGETWYDVMGNVDKEVVIDKEGNGKFLVRALRMSVWIKK